MMRLLLLLYDKQSIVNAQTNLRFYDYVYKSVNCVPQSNSSNAVQCPNWIISSNEYNLLGF